MAYKLSGEIDDVINVVIKFAVMFLIIIIVVILFGNLSGNTGFKQSSDNFFNETITVNGAYATPLTASGKGNPSLSSVVVTNATCIFSDGLGWNNTRGCIIDAANYTIRGGSINVSSTSEFVTLSNSWNVTGTVTYDSKNLVHANNIIGNATGGFTNLTSYANTWTTILAIGLLIVILVGLLVKAISGFRSAGRGGNRFGSET